jgi:hypothetical protein
MLDWLFGNPEGDAIVRSFYGHRVYDLLVEIEKRERMRRKLVASAEFIDDAGWQLKT